MAEQPGEGSEPDSGGDDSEDPGSGTSESFEGLASDEASKRSEPTEGPFTSEGSGAVGIEEEFEEKRPGDDGGRGAEDDEREDQEANEGGGPDEDEERTDEYETSHTGWGINDQKTDDDKLDFETYVSVLTEFLTHPRTNPPLTVSIEGKWGTGKSSFMALVERTLEDATERRSTRRPEDGRSEAGVPEPAVEEAAEDESDATGDAGPAGDADDAVTASETEGDADVRRDELTAAGSDSSPYFTVEFNPWRHEREDALWAAFVLEFFHQLTTDLDFTDRWSGHLRMLWYRLKWRHGWRDLLRLGLVVPLVVLALLFPPIATGLGVPLNDFGLAVGQGVSVVALGIWTWQNVADPIETELQGYLADPDYENRVSFIEQFHEDFADILDAYVGEQARVFVFIDDLDRCLPQKSAELIQSINLMISSGDPRVFFLIGMDREKVAAGIAAKHGDLLPYLRASEFRYATRKSRTAAAETIDGATDEAQPEESLEEYGLDFADNYLEKFVQIPFLIPKPREDGIGNLIQGMASVEGDSDDEEEAASETGSDTGSGSDDEEDPADGTPDEIEVLPIEDIVRIGKMVAPALEYNPRMVKTFVNLFRLRTMLATELGLFETETVTPEQLGKFVAISLRWPPLTATLRDPERIRELNEFAVGGGGDPPMPIRRWPVRERTRLSELLAAGVERDADRYRLERVPTELFWISPRIDTPSRTADEGATRA